VVHEGIVLTTDCVSLFTKPVICGVTVTVLTAEPYGTAGDEAVTVSDFLLIAIAPGL
jgi:hypothetical protein